jgi:hypothetical protein
MSYLVHVTFALSFANPIFTVVVLDLLQHRIEGFERMFGFKFEISFKNR